MLLFKDIILLVCESAKEYLMIYFYTLIAQSTLKNRIPKSFSHALAQLQDMDALESKGKHIALKSTLVIGIIDIAQSGKVFVKDRRSPHTKDAFLDGIKGMGFRKGDIILAKIKSRERLHFITLLYRAKPYCFAVLVLQKGMIKAVELGVKSHKAAFITLKASQKSLRALPPYCVVRVEIATGEITEVLGILKDAHIDEKLALNGMAKDFSPIAIQNAKAFDDTLCKEMYTHRVDLSHLPFCVIDPKDAKDHDDAIYFDTKEQTLYVAIADVSEYVSMESELDKNTRQRGFSIYFPHKVIPMLPNELSSGICSLKAQKLSLAMVWKICLNKQAHILQSELLEAMIMPQANVSYEEVEAFLHNQPNPLPKAIQKWLKAYVPYVKKAKAHRLKQGYEFCSEEITLELNVEGKISHWQRHQQGLAHSIIEESMLLANVESAKMLENTAPQGIYRIHPTPKKDRIGFLLWQLENMGFEIPQTKDIHKLIHTLQAQSAYMYTHNVEAHTLKMRDILDSMIIQSFAKATYSTHNIGHFGLGFDVYTHFTSPIRRYSDLVVHRILKAILHKHKSIDFLTHTLNGIAEELNVKERQISHIEQAFYRLKMLRYAAELLDSHKQVMCPAIVIDESSHCIALDVIPQMKITLSHSLEKYTIINVRLESVDLIQGAIYGTYLE